jgi:hypothetical protein
MVAAESGTSSCDQAQARVGFVSSIITVQSNLHLRDQNSQMYKCGQEAAHLKVTFVLITIFLLTGTQ